VKECRCRLDLLAKEVNYEPFSKENLKVCTNFRFNFGPTGDFLSIREYRVSAARFL
jgi:hypothetical protein